MVDVLVLLFFSLNDSFKFGVWGMLMDFLVAEAQQENDEMKVVTTQIYLLDSWRTCSNSENRSNQSTL